MKYWKQVHLLQHSSSQYLLPSSHILESSLMLKTSCVCISWCRYFVDFDFAGLLRTCSRLTEYQVQRERHDHPLMLPRGLLFPQMRKLVLHRRYSPHQRSCFTSMVRVSNNAPNFRQDKHYLICVCCTRSGCAYTPVRCLNNFHSCGSDV